MFWNKKIDSKEYLELKREISMLWIEIDVLSARYKRKVTKKVDIEEESQTTSIQDGFDELRKLNKG